MLLEMTRFMPHKWHCLASMTLGMMRADAQLVRVLYTQLRQDGLRTKTQYHGRAAAPPDRRQEARLRARGLELGVVLVKHEAVL